MRDYNYKLFFSFLTLVSILLLTSLTANAGLGTNFNRIVIFGDSLSDNGNLYRYDFGFLPKSPPYFDGRFSNGQVWSEYIAKHYYEKNFTSSVNFAIGGETAILHDPRNGFLPYSLTMSVDSYLLRSMLSDRSRSLFIIWVGSNDYLKGTNDVEALTTNVVNSIKYTIERLIYYGGMNFLLINIPDISKSPFGQMSPHTKTLRALTYAHNTKLAEAVAQIEADYKQVNIKLYDISKLFERLIANPQYYNIKYQLKIVNVTNSCWEGGYSLSKRKDTEEAILLRLQERLHQESKSLTKKSSSIRNFDQEGFANLVANSPALRETFIVTQENEEGAKPCGNPNGHVFWDRLHPSAVMHALLSRGISSFIDQYYSQSLQRPDPDQQTSQALPQPLEDF